MPTSSCSAAHTLHTTGPIPRQVLVYNVAHPQDIEHVTANFKGASQTEVMRTVLKSHNTDL